MKKLELLKRVAETTKVNIGTVDRVAKSLVKTIVEYVRNGEKVTLSGLGTFRIKARKAKPARNLQTGEAVQLPEGKKISFKPSRSFRKKCTSPSPSPSPLAGKGLR